MNRRRKILFLITESWYFLSHRLSLARACRDLGWDVAVATRMDPDFPIAEPGIRVVPLHIRRSARNPVNEVRTLYEIYHLLRREKPDILHLVDLKPVLYGATLASLAKIPATVSALAGMGYMFTAGYFIVRLMRRIIVFWLRVALRRKGSWLILQNDDDIGVMIEGGVVDAGQIALIRGSGVDLKHYHPTPEPPGEPVFAMVSRMLTDKGVREVVLAARELTRAGIPGRVWLVGASDPDNPTSIPREQLAAWKKEGCVEWLGLQRDIPAIWAKAHVCLLPSYREGLPKALLEAAACGRPMIAADVPGCRGAVRDGTDGFLVPPQDWRALAQAMAKLALSPDLRMRMGQAARRRAEREFGDGLAVRETLALYDAALGGAR